jgi:hypothetical protein
MVVTAYLPTVLASGAFLVFFGPMQVPAHQILASFFLIFFARSSAGELAVLGAFRHRDPL